MGGQAWKHREEMALHPDSVTEQRQPLPLNLERCPPHCSWKHCAASNNTAVNVKDPQTPQ